MPAQPASALDRPTPLGELSRPPHQLAVAGPIRNDGTGAFVAGSTAVAVCELLCGSTPMIISMLRSVYL
jgi:hypothetical protein